MRRLLALAGLLAAAANAAAEPIATYAVTVQSQHGGDRLLLGTGTTTDSLDGTTSPAYATIAMPRGNSGAITEPSGQLALLAIPKPIYGLDAGEPSPSLDSQFQLNFTVTDTASGQTSTAGMPVTGSFIGSPFETDGGAEAYLRTNGLSVTFALGAYDYHFRFGESSGESNSHITADYTITPTQTIATPEPATALLALLGLGSLAARRLRRASA